MPDDAGQATTNEVLASRGSAHSTSGSRWGGGRKSRNLLIGGGLTVVGVAAILITAFIPIPHSFSAIVSTAHVGVGDGNVAYFGFATHNFPTGAPVEIHWTSASGDMVYVTVFAYSSETSQNCSATGTSGQCRLISVGGSYTLAVQDVGSNETIETVSFTGMYPAAIL